jgi:hypothetical protein
MRYSSHNQAEVLSRQMIQRHHARLVGPEGQWRLDTQQQTEDWTKV